MNENLKNEGYELISEAEELRIRAEAIALGQPYIAGEEDESEE